MNEILDLLKKIKWSTIFVVLVCARIINDNANEKFEILRGEIKDIDRRVCRIEAAYMSTCKVENVNNQNVKWKS